jgi:hypothetical protein
MFVRNFWTCPACGVPCERKHPAEGWWTCAAGCPVSRGQGEHPKGAVDDWYPEKSPGTVNVPIPDANREGTLAFAYRGYLVWPADDRVFVVPESLGVTALVLARQCTRGRLNWDLPWDGSPPEVRPV